MPVSPIDASMMQIRRRNFTGRTDKYLPWRTPQAPVVDSIRKEAGFLDVIQDPALINELYKETSRERLNKYKRFVEFYQGKHFVQEYDDGEKKPVFNFCQVVVDKSVDFFVAKGFDVSAIEGNEFVAKALDIVWESNDKNHLMRKIAQNCSITGDAFLYITVETKDVAGVDLPKDKWRIVMNVIDSFFVFPVFSKSHPGEIEKVLIQFPLNRTDTGAVSFKTIFISSDKVIVFEDEAKISEGPNPLGICPVVHFANCLDPVRTWGQSDLESVVPMNEEYNIVANSVRKIIKYHAEPTTIIYGARASKLEKGAKKVWSGLPTDARVENLSFTADLSSTYKYMELLEQNIFKVASIPSALFQINGTPPVSNTSGVAIRMLYQPLFDKTERKREAFTVSFKRVTKVLDAAFKYMGIDLTELADNADEVLNVRPEFTDPLPYDEVAQLDADTKKQTLGITSRAALLRKYNPGEDTSRLATEIIADQLSQMLTEAEKTKLLNGEIPNFTVLFLSSLAANEDMSDFRDKVVAAYTKALGARPTEVEDDEKDDADSSDDKPKQTT